MALQQKYTLFKAIRSNDIHAVKSFLAKDHCPRLLRAGDVGFHLLRKSIEYGRTEITRLLLDHGCRAASSTFKGDSPLHLAIAKRRSCLGLVKRLLKNGAKIDQRNRRNETVLHAAFDALDNDKVVQLLMKEHLKRSVLNETNNDGLSYLHIACATAKLECVRKFVEQGGADVNAQVRRDRDSPYAGSTPLHMAVEFGRFEVIEYLLIQGANIYVADCEGSTPIHLALETKDSVVIELLFDSDDAKLNCVNKHGLSHFMAACACSTREIAESFLANKFNGDEFLNVNETVEAGATEYEMYGFTPLHFAAMFGCFDTVKYLLDEGADCCAVNRGKMNPAMIAADYGFEDVAELINAHCKGFDWFSGAR